jgi:DNA primase large subunit
MSDLSTLAKYPFLSDSKNYVKDNAPLIEELLDDPIYQRARLIGIERLDKAFRDKDVGNRSLATESDCIMELLSYPIARMVTVCIEDTYFKRRYALGEAIHAYKNLINESTIFLLEVSKEFKIDIKYENQENKLGISFIDYLHNAPTRYKEWKMINREMKNGYIQISHKDLARILQESLRNRINAELDSRECSKAIYNTFSTDINRIKNIVFTHRKKIEIEPVKKLNIELLPPCIKDILSAIQSGENVPHIGRFALVAFLNSLKMGINDILKVFSSAPDYEEERTRYQVEHITGSISSTSYKPPGCEKMRTYGICPVDKIDELCKKTRHPMRYYRQRWKNNSKKEEK